MWVRLFASILTLFGLMTFFSPTERALNLLTFAFVNLTIWKKRTTKIFVAMTLALLVLQVFVSGQIGGSAIRQELVKPRGESVETDMRGFVKTYQLMKAGESFYDALQKGMTAAMHTPFVVDIGGWREPFIFYFWTLLPGSAESTYYSFEIFVSATLLAVYLVSRKLLTRNLAILSPFVLLPYFHYPLVDLTFLQVEWWGLFFFIFGLTSFLYRRILLAGVFLALALTTRELFIVPVTLVVLVCLKTYRPIETLKLTFPILFALSFYFGIHLPNIFSRGAVISRGELGRITAERLSFANYPLAFSSWSYLLGIYRPFLVLALFSVVGMFHKMVKGHFRLNHLIILTSWIPFLTFTVFMAANGVIDRWHDYWGIYFVPLLLVSAPILILPPGR